MPCLTCSMHAWELKAPSTSTRHSKHAPIMQKGPRATPEIGDLRTEISPAARRADATLSVAVARTGLPLKVKVIFSPDEPCICFNIAFPWGLDSNFRQRLLRLA